MFKRNKEGIISNVKAFTFIEVMIVVVIIAILAVVGFYSGKGHVKISMTTEARSFIEKIVAQEKMYLIRNSEFFVTGENNRISSSKELQIDSSKNKYFKLFTITTGSAGSGSSSDDQPMLMVRTFAIDNSNDLENFSIEGIYNLETGRLEYEENFQ